MASALGTLYTAVSHKMRDIYEQGKIKYFDLDLGQVEKEELPFETPAVFFTFNNIIWKEMADTEIGTLTITFKIVFQLEDEIDFFTLNGEGREEVRDAITTLEEIHQGITEIDGETFNRFKRFNQYQIDAHEKEFMWIQVMQYQANIKSNAEPPDPTLYLDYENIVNNNAFMERKKFNLLNK